jgi:hypothetical protein
MHQLGVANLGNSFAKAGPMSEANALAEAIALGLTCDWRLDLDGPALRHFPYAAE